MRDLVIAVVGPTAAGKSALALRLAHAVGGEIVNADSMQLYAGMDIGTAKLTAAQRQGVPHHLLDVWDIRQRRASRSTSGWPGRRSARSSGAAACRSWPAGPGSTSARPWTR